MGTAATKKKKRPVKRRKPAKRVRNIPIPELAAALGVSTTTIDKYVQRGCPRHSVDELKVWRAENIKAVTQDAALNEIGPEIRRAEMAERLENARSRKLKNDLLEGRLVSRVEVERDLRTALARLVNRLNSLGTMCANLCPTELKSPIKLTVEDQVRIALKEISAGLRTT